MAPSSLRPGVHFFTCTASDSAGSVGFTNLQLTISSSPLRIHCDRTAGLLSASLPLRVDCSNSTDPDDPNTPLVGHWTCETNGMTCNTTERTLLSLSAGLVLRIPERTLTGGQYQFTLTVKPNTQLHSHLRSGGGEWIAGAELLALTTHFQPTSISSGATGQSTQPDAVDMG